MITNDYVWIVNSSRQGVVRPVKRKVVEIVEDIAVEETPIGDKFYFHYHVLDDVEWPSELKIRDDMSYGTVVKHQNDDGSGAWLSTLFYSLDEDEAHKYYEREFKRFEHVYGPHRYFKDNQTGVIFIEADYDGNMHYAMIPGERHMKRIWDSGCTEVLDYEGTPMIVPLTGRFDEPYLICPTCITSIDTPDNMTEFDHVYRLVCPYCESKMEVMLHAKVRYSTSTDIKQFLENRK